MYTRTTVSMTATSVTRETKKLDFQLNGSSITRVPADSWISLIAYSRQHRKPFPPFFDEIIRLSTSCAIHPRITEPGYTHTHIHTHTYTHPRDTSSCDLHVTPFIARRFREIFHRKYTGRNTYSNYVLRARLNPARKIETIKLQARRAFQTSLSYISI